METFSRGTVPWPTNTERQLEAKMLIALNASGGGTPGGGSVYRGVGSPEGVITAATAASLYYDTSSATWWQFNGTAGTNTGWLEVLA